jgi:phosphoribosylformylglycinamidine synthase subunit PurQ / glutaminase
LNAIVVRGPGTNCDAEAMQALKLAGFKPELVHVRLLIEQKKSLNDYRFLFFPGGFLHGDYLGSAKVFSNLIKAHLLDDIKSFVDEQNLIFGVCNGFQALVKSGVLPGFEKNYSEQLCTLTFNECAHFRCEWVELVKGNSGSLFLEGIESLHVPIAHGEGKFVAKNEMVLQKLISNKQIAFKYASNPNGSIENIAGITDETGRVLGMMPHPERNFCALQSPFPKGDVRGGAGLKLFKNAFEWLKK